MKTFDELTKDDYIAELNKRKQEILKNVEQMLDGSVAGMPDYGLAEEVIADEVKKFKHTCSIMIDRFGK